MSTATFADDYGDDIQIDTDYGITIRLDGAINDEWFVRNAADAVPLADAIYEAAGEKVEAPVRASEIPFNEAVLRLAAAHDRTVTFSYTKGDGTVIETRRFQPESLREVKGHLTITGFDPDRQDVRAFRLDRIRGEVRL